MATDLSTGADATATEGLRHGHAEYNRVKNNFRGTAEPSNIQPGMCFSKSSTEILYHRQASASKIILQETDCMNYVPSILAKVTGANMNPGSTPTMTVLYTVPSGKSCIITAVILKNSSGNLTTASISFGFDANGSDVITDSTHTELTGSTLYKKLSPKAGAVIGTATGTFKVAVNTAQGGAMTIDIDVIGYLY